MILGAETNFLYSTLNWNVTTKSDTMHGWNMISILAKAWVKRKEIRR